MCSVLRVVFSPALRPAISFICAGKPSRLDDRKRRVTCALPVRWCVRGSASPLKRHPVVTEADGVFARRQTESLRYIYGKVMLPLGYAGVRWNRNGKIPCASPKLEFKFGDPWITSAFLDESDPRLVQYPMAIGVKEIETAVLEIIQFGACHYTNRNAAGVVHPKLKGGFFTRNEVAWRSRNPEGHVRADGYQVRCSHPAQFRRVAGGRNGVRTFAARPASSTPADIILVPVERSGAPCANVHPCANARI